MKCSSLMRSLTVSLLSVMLALPTGAAAADLEQMLNREFWLKFPPGKIIFDPESKQIYWYDLERDELHQAPVSMLPELNPGTGTLPEQPGTIEQPEVPAGENPQPYADSELRGQQCPARPDLRDGKHLLKATAMIQLGDSSCTAFRTSEGTVMTNAHCAEEIAPSAHCFPKKSSYYVTERMQRCANAAMRGTVGKRMKKRVTLKFLINGKFERVACNSLAAVDSALDFAVFRCPGMDSRIPVMKISEAGVKRGEEVTLATWDYGDQKGRGPTRQRLEKGRVNGPDYDPNMATLGSQSGNSGSAIFNRFHEVAALNWGAEIVNPRAYERARMRGENPRGRAQFNQMKDVMARMAKLYPQVADEIRAASAGSGLQCRAPGENGSTQAVR